MFSCCNIQIFAISGHLRHQDIPPFVQMADLATVPRIPEDLFTLSEAVTIFNSCFENIEMGDMKNPTGELEHHLYSIAVRLSDAITYDTSALLAENARSGDLGVHHEIDSSLQRFIRESQTLLKHVFDSEENDCSHVESQRITSWKVVFDSLAHLLLHLLKTEIQLGKNCIAAQGISDADIAEAELTSEQIHTYRAAAWKWKITRPELRIKAKRDDRAVKILSEIRTNRIIDRLNTSIKVGVHVLNDLWRKEDEEEDVHDEENNASLRLKKSVLVALQCIDHNIKQLELLRRKANFFVVRAAVDAD